MAQSDEKQMAEAMETTSNDNNDGRTETTLPSVADSELEAVRMLDGLDQVFIKQPFRKGEFLMECLCGCEMQNKYEVYKGDDKNANSLLLFNLMEDSNCCARQCLKGNRPLVLNALLPEVDDITQPIFFVDKPYRCGCWCCSATNCMGRQYMEIMCGNVFLGSIREHCVCNCEYEYGVYDQNGNELCTINRCCCYCACGDVKFMIQIDGEETGQYVTKLFSGLMKEMFTTNDNFLVGFPEQLRTRQHKLLLIAASMMVEFKHFENKKDDQNATSFL